MKLPAALQAHAARFDAMTLRERVLISSAVLAVLIALWDSLLMTPLTTRQRGLTAELSTLSETMTTTGTAMETANVFDPAQVAIKQLQTTQAALNTVNAELDSTAAGLIAPERMSALIDDVLHRQHALTLISLRNKAVTSLVPPAKEPAASAANQTTTDAAMQPPAALFVAGPYVHPVELIVEGSYLDIVAYLRALEALPWHFYWQRLELQTTDFPINRAHIELSTLSLERSWLDVGGKQVHE